MIEEVLEIQAALRERMPVPDEVFDAIYPRIARFRSSVHWTPVEVGIRVAELLDGAPGGQILDIGAGVGKACIIGALTTNAAWFGIERDPAMVRVARKAAERIGVSHRTRFLVGDAMMLDWSTFGGIYLYNPFAESLFIGDDAIEPGAKREAYIAEVRAVEQLLDGLGQGTRVVTYHGFGGDMPNSLELVVREKVREDEVCLWVHTGRKVTGFHTDDDPSATAQ